jgi:two-component system cell cycle response regulator
MIASDHTILLAEDDPNDVTLIQRAFRNSKLNNSIQVVGDGEEVVAYLSGRPPYDDRELHPQPVLLLLDLDLPRKSGGEVLEWLRGQGPLSRLPVVVLTASKQPADINRAYELGANSYLVKPVQFGAVVDLVNELNLSPVLDDPKQASEDGVTRPPRAAMLFHPGNKAINGSTIKVLLVEDDDADTVLVKRALAEASRDQFDVEFVEGLNDGLGRLAAGGIDVVLLDLTLPDARGTEGFERVREAAPEVPVVVLTGEDERLAAHVVGEGQDYLVKGQFDPKNLARAVRYAIERQPLLSELRQMVVVDELTGVYNRRGLLTVGEHEIKVAERMKTRFLLLFLDIDDFKGINDGFGHAEGDRALTDTADIQRRTLRKADLIARIGGDEFCILSPGGAEVANGLTRRLKSAVDKHNREAGRPYTLEFSVGTAVFDPEHPSTMEDLLHGAGSFRVFEPRKA